MAQGGDGRPYRRRSQLLSHFWKLPSVFMRIKTPSASPHPERVLPSLEQLCGAPWKGWTLPALGICKPGQVLAFVFGNQRRDAQVFGGHIRRWGNSKRSQRPCKTSRKEDNGRAGCWHFILGGPGDVGKAGARWLCVGPARVS